MEYRNDWDEPKIMWLAVYVDDEYDVSGAWCVQWVSGCSDPLSWRRGAHQLNGRMVRVHHNGGCTSEQRISLIRPDCLIRLGDRFFCDHLANLSWAWIFPLGCAVTRRNVLTVLLSSIFSLRVVNPFLLNISKYATSRPFVRLFPTSHFYELFVVFIGLILVNNMMIRISSHDSTSSL